MRKRGFGLDIALPVRKAVFALGLLFLASEIYAQTPRKKQFFVLAIGINQYDDSFWPDLKWPKQDAKSVAENFGLNTEYERQVTTLFDKEATRENIESALKK